MRNASTFAPPEHADWRIVKKCLHVRLLAWCSLGACEAICLNILAPKPCHTYGTKCEKRTPPSTWGHSPSSINTIKTYWFTYAMRNHRGRAVKEKTTSPNPTRSLPRKRPCHASARVDASARQAPTRSTSARRSPSMQSVPAQSRARQTPCGKGTNAGICGSDIRSGTGHSLVAPRTGRRPSIGRGRISAAGCSRSRSRASTRPRRPNGKRARRAARRPDPGPRRRGPARRCGPRRRRST